METSHAVIAPPEREAPQGLTAFQESCRSLAGLASRLAAVFSGLGIDTRAEELAPLVQKLDAERFRILVLGEMKRGKSTLINALLGQEVLPAAAPPCTAVIQEIRWGENPRALLHLRHPLPRPLPAQLPSDVKAYLARAGDGPSPPLEIPISRLTEYTTVHEESGAGSRTGTTSEPLYTKAEIFWPLPLCHNGIEIIDSPGLNENATRARIACEYIAEVDAILFVLSSSLPVSVTEMRVIDDDLRGAGHQYLFFIYNRFDQVRPRERSRLVAFGKQKLRRHTELGEAGVYFLSAQQALDGKLRRDEKLVTESGVPALEEALLLFLSRDRGKVKLLQPALKLLHALDEVRNQILPTQCEMLAESLAGLEAKVEAVRPQLDDLERSRERITAEVERHRERLRADVRSEAESFLRSTARSLTSWVEDFELEHGIEIFSFEYKTQIETLATEICAKASSRMEAELAVWKDATLQPLIDVRLGAMRAEANLQIGSFCAQIDRIRSAVSQVRLPTGERAEPSGRERVLAAVGGFLAAGIHSGAHGARFGFKGLGTSVLTHLALYGFLSLLGISNPLIIGAALLSAGFGFAWIRAGTLTREARREIVRLLEAQLRDDTSTLAQAIADAVHEQTASFARGASEGLEREIRSLHEQLETILADKKAGETQVRARKWLLVETDLELRAIDSEVRAHLAVSLDRSGMLPLPPQMAPEPEPADAATATALRILFLAADPFTGLRQGLRLNQELREIRDKLRQARLNDRLQVEWEPAARPEDFLRALQDYDPHIVHFSGHGEENGTILVEGKEGEENPVTPHALASLFALVADRVQCVVLNACHSHRQARAISHKIPYVIGMRREVEDRAAITFSIGFYQALGDGRSIEEAFSFGRVLVEMYNFEDFRAPILWKNGKVVRSRA